MQVLHSMLPSLDASKPTPLSSFLLGLVISPMAPGMAKLSPRGQAAQFHTGGHVLAPLPSRFPCHLGATTNPSHIPCWAVLTFRSFEGSAFVSTSLIRKYSQWSRPLAKKNSPTTAKKTGPILYPCISAQDRGREMTQRALGHWTGNPSGQGPPPSQCPVYGDPSTSICHTEVDKPFHLDFQRVDD